MQGLLYVPFSVSEPKEQEQWKGTGGEREATMEKQRTPEFVIMELVNASFLFENMISQTPPLIIVQKTKATQRCGGCK